MDSAKTVEPKSSYRFFYGYTIVIAGTWMLILIYGMRTAYGVFINPLESEFGWSRAAVSGAFSVSMMVQGMLAPLMGSLTDRIGPRLVLVIASILSASGYALLYLTNSIWQLFLLYALIGISMSGYLVPILSTFARWFFARRNVVSGIALAGISLGTFLSPPAVTLLILQYDWRVAFAVMGVICLIFITFVSYFIRRQPSDLGLRPYGESHEVASIQNNKTGLILKEASRSSMLYVAFLIFLCFGYVMIAITVHLVPYAIDVNMSPSTAANILAVSGLLAIASSVILGIAADKIGIKYVLVFGFILLAATTFWLVSVRDEWTFYAFAALFGFGTGIVTVESPLAAWLFGLRSHGLIFGIISLGFTIGAALGPFLTGFIFDTKGSYQLAFIICGVVGIIGAVLSLTLAPIKKRSSIPVS